MRQDKFKKAYGAGLITIMLVLSLVALLGGQTPVAVAAGGLTITTNLTPFAPLDSNNACGSSGVPRAMYIQTNVQNTSGGLLTGITVSFSFSTAGFTLQSGQPSSQTIASLANNATQALFWYVTYPCTSPGTAGSYSVSATGSGGSTGGPTPGTLTTRSEISAAAGGQVQSITAGPVPPGGGAYSFSVSYTFGNPAAGADLMIQPAANLDFNAGCFQLVSDKITASSGFTAGPLVGHNNQLYFTGVNGASQNSLTVQYDFIVCPNTVTTADPFSDQTSGGSEKYLAAFGTTPVTTPLMSTQVSTAAGAPGQSVTDSVTLSGGSGAPSQPSGTVGFYICGPENPAGGAKPCSTAGLPITQVGVTKTLTVGSSSSTATSDGLVENQIGIFCWEVRYVSAGTPYTNATEDSTSGECTTISKPTAVSLSAFQATAETSGPARQISVAWSTGSEINTAGFNLYRSERAEGPYERINSDLIPASNDAVAGGEYQYLDSSVVPDHKYYYQLEDVELNGTSVRHPAVEATAPSAAAPGVAAAAVIGLGIGLPALAAGGILLLRRKARFA